MPIPTNADILTLLDRLDHQTADRWGVAVEAVKPDGDQI